MSYSDVADVNYAAMRQVAYDKGQSDLPGWCGDILPWQKQHAHRIPKGGTYLEVGVFMGASLVHMATLRPDIHLIAVDPWLDEPSQGYCGPGEYTEHQRQHGGLFLAFLHYMGKFAPDVLARVQIIRGTARTVQVTQRVDMLFVDGAHDVESVKADIDAFAPLVRAGGIVSGHDYNPAATDLMTDGVYVAVGYRYARERVRHEPPCSVWWVQV